MSVSRPSPKRELVSFSIEGMQVHAPEDLVHLQALLWQFVEARSASEARNLLERHAGLLSDTCLLLLDQTLEAARAGGDAPAVFVFHERRGILQRCREVGVAAAFDELA